MPFYKSALAFLVICTAYGCTTENAVVHSNDCVNLFQEQDYRLALEAGARALHIDPENKPAEICVGRVRRELKFQTHLIDALNAMHAKDYESALDYIDRVPLNCDSTQAADTLKSLVQKLIPKKIKRKHKRKRLAKAKKRAATQKNRVKKKKKKIEKPKAAAKPVAEAPTKLPPEPEEVLEDEELEETSEPKRRRAISAEEDSGEPTADPRAIAQVFKKKSRDFKTCLELDLRKKAGSSKRLIVQVTIGPSGNVMEVWTVSRKHRNSKLANCIERKIENWRFPSFSGGAAVIEQPIDLTVLKD
jgi:tetratricopeptide (TPR) repeat protein